MTAVGGHWEWAASSATYLGLGSTATGGKAPMQVLKGSLHHLVKKKTFYPPGLLEESVEPQGKILGHISAALPVTNSKTPKCPIFNPL